MTDGVLERLGQLEEAVRRAAETLARLREENDRLRRDVARLTDERRQVLGQIDGILNEIAKLEID
jgi:FtsZ-binding cell division protein ZapB